MGYFNYYSPQNYGSSAAQLVGSGTSAVPFSLVVTGLLPNTLYTFEAACTNTIGSGAGLGSSVQFTTPGLPADGVALDAAYDVSGNPVINGTVNGRGAGFLWL